MSTASVLESAPVTTPAAQRLPAVTLMGGAVDLSNCKTVDDVLVAADLNWDVEKRPAFYQAEDGTFQPMTDRFSTVRGHGKGLYLGDVGKGFSTLQNRAFVEFGDALRGEGHTDWEVGGSLRGGRVPFLQFKIPAGIFVGGSDQVDSYVLLANGHDGSTAIKGCVIASRIGCGNQVHGSFRGAEFKFSIRHVGAVESKVEDARHALHLVVDYMKEFEVIANSLADLDVDLTFYEDFVNELVPIDPAAGIRTNEPKRRQRAALRANWDATETLTPDLKATGWGALNLVTEVIDHGSLAIRKSKRGDAAERRFISSMEGQGASLRNRAYDMLLAEVEHPGSLAVRKEDAARALATV